MMRKCDLLLATVEKRRRMTDFWAPWSLREEDEGRYSVRYERQGCHGMFRSIATSLLFRP